LIASDLEAPWYKSIVQGIREIISPPKLPPLELTSLPGESSYLGASSKIELPWYKSLVANVRELINPPKLPPLEVTSKPVEVGSIWGAYGGGGTRSGTASVLIHVGVVVLLLVFFQTPTGRKVVQRVTDIYYVPPYKLPAAAQKAQDLDRFIIDDVRSFLFGPPGAGGLDLIALNLQRGRDHGLPDFNTVRAELGLKKYERFSQITSDPQAAQALEQLYGDINNIDLFVGLFVEQDVPGGIVGETLRAALVDQFNRTRAGDRFWYERTLHGAELARVKSTRLSDIIRRNTGIQNIQNDVFAVPQRGR